MIRSLLVVAVACSACGGAPKPVSVPASGVTLDNPTPPTTKVAACHNGKFIPPGGRMSVDYHLLGTAQDADDAHAAAIVSGACSVSEGIRTCFATSKPEFVGTAPFEITVTADGRATAKFVGHAAIDPAVATCIEEQLSSVVFAKEATGVTRYDLNAQKRLRTIKMIEESATFHGISPVSAKRALRSIFPRLRTCYEQFVRDRGIVDGNLVFDIGVRPDGSVAKLNVDFSTTFNNKALLGCVAGVVTAIKFEAPEQQASINYAVSFQASASE